MSGVLTSRFDFDLPDHLIAQHPAPRGASRMLVLPGQTGLEHQAVSDLPVWLRRGDLLIVNDTRVIPARLMARRAGSGGHVELLLVEKTAARTWTCLAKPGRKARPGTRLELSDDLHATVLAKAEAGLHELRFSRPVEPYLESLGVVPLPPYIKRAAIEADLTDYQTIFARHPGAIAAPTAGLHFTPALVAHLGEAGVALARITLHVGIGTFRPVTADLVHEHSMEAERFEIPSSTAKAIKTTRERGGRVVAVGTTVVRTLEGAAEQAGLPLPPMAGQTRLFIRPGFHFRVVDALLTNFHLPRSTLLMLVSAFAGRERVLAAYHRAIGAGYRFYSYGDAMLLTERSDRKKDSPAEELQHLNPHVTTGERGDP